MMRSAITVSLVPEAKGGPFVFWNGLEEACQQASHLGFDAIEVFPRDAQTPELQTLPALAARTGLRVAAIGTGGGWVAHRLTLTQPDADRRARAAAFIRDIIDVAGQMGAPAIIGSMQGKAEGDVARDQALDWLAQALGELGEHAARHGVPLLYEPLNRYETNLHNRIAAAGEWLATAGVRNVRLLADLFHMNIEEADLAGAIHAAGPAIGHVHFADSNRQAIGRGHTTLSPVLSALRATGYRGYLSAEILPLPDPLSAARQTIDSFRQATEIR